VYTLQEMIPLALQELKEGTFFANIAQWVPRVLASLRVVASQVFARILSTLENPILIGMLAMAGIDPFKARAMITDAASYFGVSNPVPVTPVSAPVNEPEEPRRTFCRRFGAGRCGRFNQQQRHHAICDACDSPIVGIRYKCASCSDYDLCQTCEPSKDSVHPQHVFLKIEHANMTIPEEVRYRRFYRCQQQQQQQQPEPSVAVEIPITHCSEETVVPAVRVEVEEKPAVVAPAVVQEDDAEEEEVKPVPVPVSVPAPVEEEKPAVVEEPAFRYAAQLRSLIQMGFSDTEFTRGMLVRFRGNLGATVNALVA
jgi:hypothetical protein